MDREIFEALVTEQYRLLPAHIMEKLSNVDFVLENEATQPQRSKHGMRKSDELLGLYEGVPLNSRGAGYFGALPDKISLFQGPIERVTHGDDGALKHLIYETLLHEIGHHFGFCEEDVRRLARKRASEHKDDAV